MNITYDPQSDAMYIQFSTVAPTRTEQVSDDVMVDFKDDVLPVGVEILYASEKIPPTNLSSVTYKVLDTPRKK